MAPQPEHLDPPAHSVTEPQRSRPTAYIHSAGMKTRLFVVTTANIMGRIFPLLPFLSIPVSCGQRPEEPPAKDQTDGAGREGNGEELPTVVPRRYRSERDLT